mgnify:CR=1 FL=1
MRLATYLAVEFSGQPVVVHHVLRPFGVVLDGPVTATANQVAIEDGPSRLDVEAPGRVVEDDHAHLAAPGHLGALGSDDARDPARLRPGLEVGQAPDHPVSVQCLENDYLKCFICRVV